MVLSQNSPVMIDVYTSTTYSSVTGVALAQGVTTTTATVFTAYGSFATQIAAQFAEYRVESIRVTITPVPNTAYAGLYTSGLFITPFWGAAPTASIAVITKLPKHKVLQLNPRSYKIHWHRQNTPEDKTLYPTTGAVPVLGGIVSYIGASAPTLGTAYLLYEVKYRLYCRSRVE